MASSVTARRISVPGMAEPPNATWFNRLVAIGALAFPALTIEIDAFTRLDCDLYQ